MNSQKTRSRTILRATGRGALLLGLLATIAATHPAAADGWEFSSGASVSGTTTGNGESSGFSAPSSDTMVSTVNVSAVADGSPYLNASASSQATGGIGAAMSAMWVGNSPVRGLQFQLTIMWQGLNGAAAPFGGSGSSQVAIGAGNSSTGGGGGGIPADGSIGLPGHLESDSPTANPPGAAMDVSSYSPSGSSSYPTFSYSDMSLHGRSFFGTSQNGSNTDSVIGQVNETATFPADYFNYNSSTPGMGQTSEMYLEVDASSSGPGAGAGMADGVIIYRGSSL